MKINTLICAAIVGVFALSAPVHAQEKTVKACEDEWKADKAANQKNGITEKAYVAKCRAGAVAAKPAAPAAESTKAKSAAPAAASSTKEKSVAAPAAAEKKTVKACEDEWKADKAANQKNGITEKAYVQKCRAGAVVAAPAAAPVAAPAAAPAAQAKPAAPAPAAPSAMAPAKPATPAPAAASAPTGANQYAMESLAKVHCPTATVVWANLDSKIYHFTGHADYGHTKSGAYMCEKDATAQGIRAAKNEKHP